MSTGAGWRPDPETPGHLRYWDGHGWTPFAVRAPSVPSAEDPGPRRHVLLTVAAVLVVLFAAVGLWDGTEDDDPRAGRAPAATDESERPSARSPSDSPSPSEEATPEVASVPRLVGLSVARARTEATATGIGVGTVRRVTSAKKPGTVLKQSHQPSSVVGLGSAIDLVVSAPWPRTPSVVGTASSVAVDRLKQAGFRVSTTQRRTTSGKDGVVLEQVPRAGGTIKPRSAIRLVIADLHEPPEPQVSNCTTGYEPCLPPASDYDCAGGSGDGPAYAHGPIRVTGSDPYDLDREGDGIACEP
jgi:hypothetical protein